MAFESPQVTSSIVEATQFPELVTRYRITGVPKTVVNEQVEILGAQPEATFVPAVLGAIEDDGSESA